MDAATPRPARLPALDWMRGLVMMLMAVDHASDVFNANKVTQDSAVWGAVGAQLEPWGVPWHFLTRWVTHLCAPTFVFLAGTALALSVERRAARGESAWSIDRHLLYRGLSLIALELWIGLGFHVFALQVLYAIGGSILAMVLLRRLPSVVLCVLGLGWIVFGELALEAMGLGPGVLTPPWWGEALFVNGLEFLDQGIDLGYAVTPPYFIFVYPIVPWLAMMMLGWAFGRWLLTLGEDRDRRALRRLLGWAALAAVAFTVQRLADGPDGAYGNYWLPRSDGSWLRWLQVSKYPPSLAYTALELGLMALLLALCFALQSRGKAPRRWNPVLVFGQCALFFYLLHMHVMSAFARIVWGVQVNDPEAPFGLASAWLGATAVLVVLYPACLWFRAQRRANPSGWTRWL